MAHVWQEVKAFEKGTSQTPSSSESGSSTPYHGILHMQQIRSHDKSYGLPVEGSTTEYRGKSAGVHISKEIIELCDIINSLGTTQDDGTVAVTFGVLFETYTKISNKLVGMLMRARKQKLVHFEGEMLFQRRDDHVLIYLIKMPVELLQDMEKQKEQLKQHKAVTK